MDIMPILIVVAGLMYLLVIQILARDSMATNDFQ